MALKKRIALRFSWPEMTEAPFREEFFLGVWHASAEIDVQMDAAPAGTAPAARSGPGYLLLSSTTDLHPGQALVHDREVLPQQSRPEALAFRGYIVDPPFHCWSGSDDVFAYWEQSLFREHNGIFAAARVFPDRIELITDAFGISPLYYRRLRNGAVLFATSARYLHTADDSDPDPIAARMLLHRGALCGDVSIVPQTRRCKPGHVVTFTESGKAEQEWFQFGSLPVGTEKITAQNLGDAEEAFQQAMDRCLRLMPGTEHHLPLSSGDDSRRILAALLKRGERFQALTVRVRQRQHRDLDGRFAAEMAHSLGFRHEAIEVPEPAQYRRDHHIARTLFSGEVREHAWMPAMVRHMRSHPSLVFEGLGGDIFGNTGFGEPQWHTMPEAEKMEQMVREFVPSFSGRPYRKNALVPIEQVWAELADHLSILPEGPNRADYAFVLVRARRGTGPAMQHLIPAGHVPVYPYFDLNHIRATMQIDSMDKIEEKLQARCLRVFWPEIYKFPGSRRIPPGIPEGSPSFNLSRQLACIDQMRAECAHPVLLSEARPLLRPVHYVQAVLAPASDVLKERTHWWLERVLLLLSWKHCARLPWSARTGSPA